MRIPRFAFALLVVAAVALGSSLTMLKVRAHEQGKVLLLKAKSPGATMECALSLEDLKEANCGETAEVGAGILNRSFRIISKDGDRIELGVRAEFRAAGAGPHTTLFEEVADLPEARYQFEPGKQLEVDVAGSGTMVITGELMDHEPVFVTEEGEQLDPKVDELRVASPVLLHDKKVLFDFEGGSAFAAKGEAIEMYVPGKGLYRLSLSSMEGAVEGRINLNRISFELNGQPYTFLTGVPVARGKQIWVLLDPNFKPLGGAGEEGFIGVNNSLPKTPPKN